MKIIEKTKGLIAVMNNENFVQHFVYPNFIHCIDKEGIIVDLYSPLYIAGNIYCYNFKSKNSVSVIGDLSSNADIRIKEGNLVVFGRVNIYGKFDISGDIIVSDSINAAYYGFAVNPPMVTDIKCSHLEVIGDVKINGKIIAKGGYKVLGEIKDKGAAENIL